VYEGSGEIPLLATLEQTARLLQLSKRKVWQMGTDGSIRIERFGRSVRYCVREFLAGRKGNDDGKE
jgi:hypothetical protein